MPGQLDRRPQQPTDRDFLARLYASTREPEMAATGWAPVQVQAFLEQQFEAQSRFYRERFGRASFEVLLLQSQPVGRLYVERREDEIRIIDIALLPEYRGRGFGAALVGELLAEAAAIGCPVRIHVEQYNPALAWYQRLGFRAIGDQGVYYLMEWRPPAHEAPAVPAPGRTHA